jgi:hypothetical protein
VAVFAADAPMVPVAGPGVFTVKPAGPGRFRLTVAGHKMTSRGEIEKYLAYRAARHTTEQGGTWFTLQQEAGAPVPARDTGGRRYSFRMAYFRPVWRYKEAAEWRSWSPFSGEAFPKAVGDFAVTAEIVVRKGPMDDADPLAFEAWALSDLLLNQVSPPQ